MPPHLLASLQRSGGLPPVPRRDRFPAALLFADMSGFTALTERLQGRGREGAEEIASVVNRAFRPVLRAVASRGGSVASFGGDAVFALFPGPSPVRRAVAAAEEIRDHFAAHATLATSAGRVRLSFRQVIHFGQVSGLHLGRPSRRCYVATGPSVAALARLEERTEAGTLALSAAARRQQAREAAPRPSRERPDGLAAATIQPYVGPHVVDVMGRFKGEFRRATMVFFETKGSSLAQLQRFVRALFDVLDAHGGVLVGPDLSPQGTKWLCAFGAPVTHEDDPERAVAAAQALLRRRPPRLPLRGGMHVGTVANIWIGDRARRSYELLGDVTNTAARALSKAAWGEVLVTEAVRRAAKGFATSPRGAHRVKGKAQPLQLHAVGGSSQGTDRAASTGSSAPRLELLVPMVGRDRELARIGKALRAAREGSGSAIGIVGEAGLGKSRLKYEAAIRARALGFEVHEGRALAFGGMPYASIAALVRSALQVGEDAPRAELAARVDHVAAALGLSEVDRRHLADVLDARPPGAAPAPTTELLAPRTGRVNNQIAVRALFHALARARPLLLVLEDMHWADAASAEAAAWLADSAAAAPLVVLLLARPGAELPAALEQIRLEEIGEEEIRRLVAGHLGTVPEAVTRLVVDRAAGNPFYVEELARHLQDAGFLTPVPGGGHTLVRTPGPMELPGSLESLIGARLDRLSPETRSVAQHASVIGRTFLLAILEQLREVARSARPGIEELRIKELVFRSATEPRLAYIFKHALTRDSAYASILAGHRRRLHRAVADAIEELLGREGFEAMIAHHRECARQTADARAAYLEAARAAVLRHAREEAAHLYGKHLDHVPAGDVAAMAVRLESVERALVPLGRLDEAAAACRRSIEEARAAGARSEEARGHLGLAEILRKTAGGETEGELRSALRLFQEQGDAHGVARAQGALGHLAREHGRLDDACRLIEQSLAGYRAIGERLGESRALSSLAYVIAKQGRTDEALRLAETGLAISRELGDDAHLASDLCSLAMIKETHVDPHEATVLHEEAVAIAHRIGNRPLEGRILGNLGGARFYAGDFAGAATLFERALALHRELGDVLSEGVELGRLGVVRMQQGRGEEAVALLERALDIAGRLGDRSKECNTLGNLGLALSQLGRNEEARRALEQALASSRERGDRVSETSHLGSLAHLCSEEGELAEARKLYEQALVVARQTRVGRLESAWLANIGCIILLTEGDVEKTGELLRAGDAKAREIGDLACIGAIAVARARLALAEGRSAEGELEEAQEVATRMGAGPGSELATGIAQIERAIGLRAAGKALVAGVPPEAITPAQYRWMRGNRPDLVPAEVWGRVGEDGKLGGGG